MSRVVKGHDERYGEFLGVARKLFLSHGYNQTTVREIIDTVGVAKGTFYHYFESKQAVLEAVVAELSAEGLALMKAIVDEPTLSACEKWTRAAEVIVSWQIERKDELLTLMRLVYAGENALLAQKLDAERARNALPIMVTIIEQGIDEGEFRTAYVRETAEIVYAILRTVAGSMIDILLAPERYENPEALVRRRLTAAQVATERILKAKPGSLPMVQDDTLASWFAHFITDDG